jgi:hypothetical protein
MPDQVEKGMVGAEGGRGRGQLINLDKRPVHYMAEGQAFVRRQAAALPAGSG